MRATGALTFQFAGHLLFDGSHRMGIGLDGHTDLHARTFSSDQRAANLLHNATVSTKHPPCNARYFMACIDSVVSGEDSGSLAAGGETFTSKGFEGEAAGGAEGPQAMPSPKAKLILCLGTNLMAPFSFVSYGEASLFYPVRTRLTLTPTVRAAVSLFLWSPFSGTYPWCSVLRAVGGCWARAARGLRSRRKPRMLFSRMPSTEKSKLRSSLHDDVLHGERFIRVVGRRRPAPLGELPPRATREALSDLARYRTRAPKGVFIYASHEEANADRQCWQVEAMVGSTG